MKRLTISLDEEITHWLDGKIEEKIFHNYQHAIDYIVTKFTKGYLDRFDELNLLVKQIIEEMGRRKEKDKDESCIEFFGGNVRVARLMVKRDCLETAKSILNEPRVKQRLKENNISIDRG